ncbi:MAG: LLM class flavin-dependent oxidoreductase, partial [Acidobacteria bacterium]|nr:LLM class flavin-dependent oxidoreductase [Acidobacteriota bacterium]
VKPSPDFETHPTIHGQFASWAAATPGAVAAEHAGRALTYAEVAGRAQALAGRLRRLPAGPEAPVAVLVERGLELPGALLGILAADRAFLPLDPANPPGRLAQLLARARPGAIVAQRSLAARLPPPPAEVLWLDDGDAPAPGGPRDTAEPGAPSPAPPAAAGAAGAAGEPERESAAAAGRPACVLYVADGNGLPRAVTVTHRTVAACFAAIDLDAGPVAAGSALAPTASGCELAAIELLWALSRGCRAVLDGDGGRDPARHAAAGAGSGAGADRAASAARGGLAFTLFYFGNYAAGEAAAHYRLVLEGAKFADRHGFAAIWTPERHFHEFGGLYPNPSVLSAAIAAVTERLQIRAGSVVLPLHDPLRVAEEWALVDNLSGGRVGVSFASGWHANDFVLNPGAYQDRNEIMRQRIETVRRLWRGEALRLPGGAGAEVEVRIFPRPVQAELPVWVTAAGSPATFRLAGELGAGVLTHMLGQEAGEIAAKIRVYREAWRQAGHGPGGGRVTVMLHTFVGATLAAVHEAVRGPLSAYLKTSFGLLRSLAESVGVRGDPAGMAPGELDLLVSRAYERYVAAGAGLIGTPETCAPTLLRLRQMGVDEVACLIDFGVAADQVLAGLAHLDELRRLSGTAQAGAGATAAPAARPDAAGTGVVLSQLTAALARRLAAAPAEAAALGGLGELLAGRSEVLAGRR